MSMEERCCQRNMVKIRDGIGDFNNGLYLKYFRLWARLLKVNDDLMGI